MAFSTGQRKIQRISSILSRGGPENPSESSEKAAIRDQVRTESGTPGEQTPPHDPDLAILISRWPRLSKEARLAIVTLVAVAPLGPDSAHFMGDSCKPS